MALVGLSALSPCYQQTTDVDRAIGGLIKSANSLQEHSDVVDKWKDSFDFVKVCAAFVQAARLSKGRAHPATVAMLNTLADTWSTVQQDSSAWGLANVLWACGKLKYTNSTVWSSSLQTLLQPQVLGHANATDVSKALHGMASIAVAKRQVVPGVPQGDVVTAVKELVGHAYVMASHPSLEGISTQSISNTLWSCAKLKVCPADAELSALLRALSQPSMLGAADTQHLANSVYAVSVFQQEIPEWKSPIQRQIWERLFSDEVLRRLADHSSTRDLSRMLLSLAWLSSGDTPAFGKPVAQQWAVQLLSGRVVQAARWDARDISTGLLATALLDLQGQQQFYRRLKDTAYWLPRSDPFSLSNIVWACVQMGLHDSALMQKMVYHGLGLLQQQRGRSGKKGLPASEYAALATTLSWALAKHNMQQSVADVVELIRLGRVQDLKYMHPADSCRLWFVHCWLRDNSLLDGQGLNGLLSAQHLNRCEAAAQQDSS